jgi:acetyl esterase/lipase
MTYARGRLDDPEYVRAIPLLPERDVHDPVGIRADLARERRARIAAGRSVDTSGVEILDLTVPAGPASPAVPARLYRPHAGTAPYGLVLHLHSGGFYAGSLETEHWQAVQVAREADVVVLSVDYRLAPEHPYPAGLMDGYRVLEHAAVHAPELAVDPARFAVLGSSAGGGLAAALVHLTRDRGGPPLVAQLLLYPVLDDRMETGSMRDYAETPAWSGRQAAVMWQHYLPHGSGPDRRTGQRRGEVPIHAAPARASCEELTSMPVTFVATAQHDPLRDEGLQYAQRLLAAGVPVELHSYPGVLHGFDSSVPEARVAQQANDDVVRAVKRYVADAVTFVSQERATDGSTT